MSLQVTIEGLTRVDVVLSAPVGGKQVTVVAEGGLDVDGLDTLMEMLEVVRSAVPSGCPLCGEDITGPVTWVKSEDAEATWVMVHPECAELQKELDARAEQLAAREAELDAKEAGLEPLPLTECVRSTVVDGLDIHVGGQYRGTDGVTREVLNLIESEAGDGPTTYTVLYKVVDGGLQGEKLPISLDEFVRWMGDERDELGLEDGVCRGTGDEAAGDGVDPEGEVEGTPLLCWSCNQLVTGIEPDEGTGVVAHPECEAGEARNAHGEDDAAPEPEEQGAGGTVSMGQDEAAEAGRPAQGDRPEEGAEAEAEAGSDEGEKPKWKGITLAGIKSGARFTDGEKVRQVISIGGDEGARTVDWQGVYPDGSRRMGKVYTWSLVAFAAWARQVFVRLAPAEKPKAAAPVVSKKAEKVGASPERVKKPAKSEHEPKPAAPLRELDG